MKALTIDANSWHYKLALYGHLTADPYSGRLDLCRYFWALLRGALKAPAIVAAVVLAAMTLVVHPLAALVTFVKWGHFDPPLIGIIGIVIAGYAIFFFVVLYVARVLRERRERRDYRSSEPGLIKTAYRGWKEKTCVLVEVKHSPGTV
jgi:uncharacterized integral membrane protein